MEWDYLKFSGSIEKLATVLEASDPPNISSLKKQLFSIIRLIPSQWRSATKALISSANDCTFEQLLHVLDYDLKMPGEDSLQLSTFNSLKQIVTRLNDIERIKYSIKNPPVTDRAEEQNAEPA